MIRTLVLVRHGESDFNAMNRFTGLTDVGLTPKGVSEAAQVGARLAAEGVIPGTIFTSEMRRTVHSGMLVKTATGGEAELISDAALNERDYGDLTGLNKAEAARRWGDDQVRRWRRSYREAPPGGESLRNTVARVLPYVLREILPRTLERNVAVVVGHGNVLRAIAFGLEEIGEKEIADLEFDTGQAVAYQLSGSGRVLGKATVPV
jgi:2,3-bisphosphoglycerate-dependent phosphoglycerate mutase